MNIEHVMKLTKNWRDIAVYIGDNALVNRIMVGDLVSLILPTELILNRSSNSVLLCLKIC